MKTLTMTKISLITYQHNLFVSVGKASRTVDLQLEAQIEVLRDTQRKYENILKLSRALTNHFFQVVQTQRSLGDAFSELAQKSPELQVSYWWMVGDVEVLSWILLVFFHLTACLFVFDQWGR